jgi:1-deoxy-D-xylulose-5-phosphate synthase
VLKRSASKDVLIISVGTFAHTAMKVAELLAAQGIGATIVDPRWIVPVQKSIIEMAAEHRLVVTLEDGVRVGGFGSRVRQELRANGVDTGLNEIGVPAEFLEHAEREEILERLGLTPQAIAHDIVAQVVGTKVPHAKPLEAEKSQLGSEAQLG